MSSQSLLNEARALVNRSRSELQQLQQDRKRQTMEDQTTVSTITTDQTIVSDPAALVREQTLTGAVTTPAESEITGELTSTAVGRLYQTGMSVDAIAKSNSVSYAKARRLLRESGVELRDPSARLKGRTRKSAS